jgi:hypothetical protein
VLHFAFTFSLKINPATINLDPALYTGEHFHSIEVGAKNGIQNGQFKLDLIHLKLIFFFYNLN